MAKQKSLSLHAFDGVCILGTLGVQIRQERYDCD